LTKDANKLDPLKKTGSRFNAEKSCNSDITIKKNANHPAICVYDLFYYVTSINIGIEMIT